MRFAVDQAMIACTETRLQRLMDNTNRVVNRYGMRINIKKTKVMKFGKEQGRLNIEVDGKVLEQVGHFKCT